MTDKQNDQQNDFIINKKRNSSTVHLKPQQVDLKSRLFDKGFNNTTMPSVKRQLTSKSTDKILTAKLNSQQVRQNKNSQPIYQQQSVVLQKNEQKNLVQSSILKKIKKVEADIFHFQEQGLPSSKGFSARAHTAKMNFQSQGKLPAIPAVQESIAPDSQLFEQKNSKINNRYEEAGPDRTLQSAQMLRAPLINNLEFNLGFDFHASIHNPEQIFGRPLSRINSATSRNGQIGKIPPLNQDIKQVVEEVQMLEMLYTGFGEKEIPKTKFLVDKLSGKFNIDKRYLETPKYGHITENEIEDENSVIEDMKLGMSVTRQSRPPSKLDKYVDLILKNVTNVNEFIYLNCPNENDPYDLQVVDYKVIQEMEGQTNCKNEYYTISKKGLCHYVNGKPSDFMQLAFWLKERKTYDQIKSLQFFIKFRKWKTLKMWKKNVTMRKNQNCSRALQDKLFFLNPILSKTLLNFRANTYNMQSELRFIGFDDKDNYLNNQEKIFKLEQFKEYQQIIRKKVNSEVQIYSNICREIVKKGFDDSLEKLRKSQFLVSHKAELGAKEKQQKQEQTIFGSKEGAYDALGFPDGLNFEKRSDLRKECIKFVKFAYLVDFMAMEALSKIFTFSIGELEDRIRILVNDNSEFCPMFMVSVEPSLDMDLIPSDQLDVQQIAEFVPPPAGNSKPEDFNIKYHVKLKPPKVIDALLSEDSESEEVFVNPDKVYERVIVPNICDFWLKVHPDKELFQNDLMKCTAEGINSIQIFERWSRHKDMDKYTRILEEWDDVAGGENKNVHVSNYLNPSEWLENSPLKILQDVFQNLIDDAYQKVDVFINSQFHNFLQLFWENKNINFDIFNSEDLINPGDSYYHTFKILNIQKEYFESQIPCEADLGFIRVDTKDLRKKIVYEPLNILKNFARFTPPMLEGRNNIIKNWLTNQASLIKANAPNIDEFVKRQNDLKETINHLPGFRKKFTNLDHIKNIMVEFHFDLGKNLLHEIVETTSDLKRLENYIQQAEEQQDKNLEKYVREVNNKSIPELTKNTHELDQLVQDKKLLTLDINMDQAINTLTELDSTFQILEKKSILYNHYEKTLNLPFTKFEDLDILKIDLSLKLDMWKTLRDWQNLTSGWIDSKFTEINVKEIKEKADFYTKIVQRCVKNMTQNAVLDKVKKMVYQFKDTMPVVVALRNKDLKDYHWSEIKRIIGKQFVINEKFTLRNLLDMVKVDTVYDIQDIATQATQEVALKTLYEELSARWKQLQFTVKDSKEGRAKDAILLANVDILYTALDEMLLSLNTILGSRYLKNLRDDVDILQKKVINVQETIDDMVQVQKNWQYFENIFKSTEIRQKLKEETSSFDKVDTFFKKQLIQIKKSLYLYKYLGVNIAKSKKEWNVQKEILNTIQLALDQLLEEKRNTFPRLFFLSNDEVLEILAKSGDIESVQKNIKKCFEGVGKLIITENGMIKNITGMISPEGEVINFAGRTVRVAGDIEQWLSSFQDAMRDILFKNMKKGKQDYEGTNKERQEWVLDHAAQIIGVVATIMWTQYTEHFILQQISENPTALYEWAGLNHLQLDGLTKLINSGLPDLQHKSIVSLITKDVHGRDIIDCMYVEGVTKITDFIWQKQLRYYWGEDEQSIIQIKQVNVTFKYGFEYIGASARLVITPLTDRAWMTITGALNIQLGASLSGPAGSGKTESLKDLAKGIGQYYVVFNCTKQIEYKLMGKLFSGLSQQGAWACFDEFNKIDVEVLSVIAQQLQTIRAALVKGVDKFIFIDKEIPLKSEGYGVFITMNPGYAGRTELPENLKIQFRPVSMMIPDYRMVAEIILLSQGFENARNLSIKINQLYKLANEQLSQQDHYDFGMRSMKSVLVMAGNLKKAAEIALVEESILIRAMRECNIPKFLENDITLFTAIVKDLFPNFVPMEIDNSELSVQVQKSTHRLKFWQVPTFQQKIVQIFETLNVRFGVMLVGQTTCGKTTAYQILAESMTQLRRNQSKDERFQEVQLAVVNPKSISVEELYGAVNNVTQEWNDGLGSALLREAAADETDKNQWIVFDGPVDTLWVENMNTVLDDNQILCLANGQRIKLRAQMRILFEIENLKMASPSTVSRCGMVYMSSQDLGWRAYVKSWLLRKFTGQQKKSGDSSSEKEKEVKSKPKQNDVLSEELRLYIQNLFETQVDKTLSFIREKLQEIIVTVDLQLVINLCNLLDCFISPEFGFKVMTKVDEQKRFLSHVFAFAFIWSVGITVQDTYHDQLNNLIRELFQNVIFPNQETVFSYYLDVQNDLIFKNWNDKIIPFQYDKQTPYFNILVHTVDTTRYSFIIQQLIMFKKHIYLSGNGGTGKSVMLKAILEDIKGPKMIDSYQFNFSAQTSSIVTQLTIEDKLKKKSKQELGSISGHQIVLFIDDCNMPLVEEYGAQPTIELLRLYIDKGFLWDRKEKFLKKITDTTLLCCSAPPGGGGRSELTQRFTRHFNLLILPQTKDKALFQIFKSIILGFFISYEFQSQILLSADPLVEMTIELYQRFLQEKLPIPSKFHYTFNVRDLSKVFQGMMMSNRDNIKDEPSLKRLWVHEVSRVFSDRLVNDEDKTWFNDLIVELLYKKFGKGKVEKDKQFSQLNFIFSDIMKLDQEKDYEEITDVNKLVKLLEDKQDNYNNSGSNVGTMQLVFFEQCIFHILRILRILRQVRGNLMLIGIGGCGKQSLTRMSSYIYNYMVEQIEVTTDYDINDFREFIQKNLMYKTGVKCKKITFMYNDNQTVTENFLEDINNMLNTGEVPNLYRPEDKDNVLSEIKDINQRNKLPTDPESCQKTFLNNVRMNLHIVLCMSPVGKSLRIRCRQFSSLIDCCSLNWFESWPESALQSVCCKLLQMNTKFPVYDKIPKQELIQHMGFLFKEVHIRSMTCAEDFYNIYKRKVYFTPKSYLDFINLYMDTLVTKREEFLSNENRLTMGLTKLVEAQKQITQLQENLNELKPKLETQNVAVAQSLRQVEKDSYMAQQNEGRVSEETDKVAKQKDRIQLIAEEAQSVLDKVMPELSKAQDAVEKIDRGQLVNLRTMNNPPAVVLMVFEAVTALLGQKSDWPTCKGLLQDLNKFIQSLIQYDKDNISPTRLKKLYAVLARPEFDITQIAAKVPYVVDIANFCKAMKVYALTYEKILPKKKQAAELQAELDVATAQLQKQSDELNVIQANVHKLREETNRMIKIRDQIEEMKELTEARMMRARKLLDLTENEAKRWRVTVISLNMEVDQLFGDAFMTAGCISYNGPFTGQFRKILNDDWIKLLQQYHIPISEKFSIVKILGDPVIIRSWCLEGLPSDNVSLENSIYAVKSTKWPLFLDPQLQATKWIKNTESRLLVCLKFQGNWMKDLSNALQYGYPVIIEGVDSMIDSSIDIILLKGFYEQEGQLKIKFGGNVIVYEKNFRLYLATEKSNPNYLPDVFIKLNVINFTSTFDGLEEQLLSDVVKTEQPKIESQRDANILNMAQFKQRLSESEVNILRLLAEAVPETILDNVNLIYSLEVSKFTAFEIHDQMKESEQLELKIEEVRESYRQVSIRGSILYFVIQDLNLINPMYQYSQSYVQKLFNIAIQSTPAHTNLQEKQQNLIIQITKSIFTDISEGLFEKDKIIFSFILAVRIEKHSGVISESLWNLFLRGPHLIDRANIPQIPVVVRDWITQPMWDFIHYIDITSPSFRDLGSHIANKSKLWKEYFESPNPQSQPLPETWNNITSFEKMIILKIFRPQKILFAITTYIEQQLGPFYIDPPQFYMDKVITDSNPKTPVIFILTAGADPSQTVIQYAKKMKMEENLQLISLGQGQGDKADAIIQQGLTAGYWIYLQNCHLAKSWLNKFQIFLKTLRERNEDSHHKNKDDIKINNNYRIFLTSMPDEEFPISILANSIKITLEPPRGLRANMTRSLQNAQTYINDTCKTLAIRTVFHKLVWGICYFHAIVQERGKFGPLGWNIIYQFNDSDLDTTFKVTKMLLEEQEQVPWNAMLYISGHINYGGRITDDWDRRCLMSNLKRFFTPDILKSNYLFSGMSNYTIPSLSDYPSYKKHIDSFPLIDDPQIFGLNDNANIAYQSHESSQILKQIRLTQPKQLENMNGKLIDQQANEIIDNILRVIPIDLAKERGNKDLFEVNESGFIPSLSTVLLQEIQRMNILLNTIRKTLSSLKLSIVGMIVMSDDLDQCFQSVLNNQVPNIWVKVAYPSLKPLGGWISDLIDRINFISDWLIKGQQTSYWISGFFFPQGFLTGILQNHSRKYKVPIDELDFSFKIQDFDKENILLRPPDGAQIHGVFLEGANWDRKKKSLIDSIPGQSFILMPVIHLSPIQNKPVKPEDYKQLNIFNFESCPFYKTSKRYGDLSTTGLSSNFILSIDLPSLDYPTDYWILRGAALISQINEA